MTSIMFQARWSTVGGLARTAVACASRSSRRLPAVMASSSASSSSTTTTVQRRSESTTTAFNAWENFEMAPLDPIVGLNELYAKDEFPHKVIVGVGAYRDDSGHPYVLPCVRKAERLILEQELDMEYAPITGDAKFVRLAMKFAFGDDCPGLKDRSIQGVQTLSGTGGLRIMGELLAKHGHGHIYVPNPTWGNHIPIFANCGMEVLKYRYYDTEGSNLDFQGMIEDISAMPKGSAILLHASAHNPTGMDPNLDQWKQLSDLIKEKHLFPFFDNAYQGFATGDPDRDAAALRMFVEDGHNMAVCQSFSKNFGLYGHRTGALSFVTSSADEADRVISQIKRIIRPMYSNPPRHGARIVSTVLSDPELTNEFLEQCAGMAKRIHEMRSTLVEQIHEEGSTKSWDHITKQIGMFAYSGLTPDQVMQLRENHHVYCTMDGRISMAGVTSRNVDYIASSIHDVTKN